MADVGLHQFAQANAAAVEDLQHRQVPLFQGVARLVVKKFRGHVRVQGIGQAVLLLGGLGRRRRVALHNPLLLQMGKEAAQAGQQPLQGARAGAAAVPPGHRAGQMMRPHRLPRRLHLRGKAFDVPLVSLQGVYGITLLKPQMVEKTPQLIVHWRWSSSAQMVDDA